MVEAIQNRSKSSVQDDQPRSFMINWMKYDVTNENIDPNTMKEPSKPKQLSPLRLKLKEKGEKVLQQRQLLTTKQINSKIEDARIRKDHS